MKKSVFQKSLSDEIEHFMHCYIKLNMLSLFTCIIAIPVVSIQEQCSIDLQARRLAASSDGYESSPFEGN